MKTIAVSNGDIQLNGGKIIFAQASQKLVQDITRWLEEPIGTGYTTPGFGSTLIQLIGQAQDSTAITTVQNEIARVLQLYQGQQILYLQNSQSTAQLAKWNRSEIIQTVNSISATIQGNAIVASIVLTTLNNNPININVSIDNSGVKVQNG